MAENADNSRWLHTAIITCPQRAGVLQQTLVSYHDTDLVAAPYVFTDDRNLPDKRVSQAENALRALKSMLDVPWQWLLFAEDDVEFNRHILHNLFTWPELCRGYVQCGRLYSVETYGGIAPNAAAVANSQGILLSRKLVTQIVADWYKFAPHVMSDIRIFRIAGRVHTHQPNLIQHRTEVSTWGGAKHVSTTFDYDWRR